MAVSSVCVFGGWVRRRNKVDWGVGIATYAVWAEKKNAARQCCMVKDKEVEVQEQDGDWVEGDGEAVLESGNGEGMRR